MFMQRTQRKDAVRNIFKRKISYLSILLTITLGVTGLLCIFFLAVSMEKAKVLRLQNTLSHQKNSSHAVEEVNAGQHKKDV